jgi:hypothetical protein
VAAADFAFLEGKMVEQIWVWADTIHLIVELRDEFAEVLGGEPRSDLYIDIRGGVLIGADGEEVPLDVDERPAEAGVVLGLLRQRIASAHHADCTLHLSFADGTRVRALPDPNYESWTVGAEGRTFQCMPGGEVGSW